MGESSRSGSWRGDRAVVVIVAIVAAGGYRGWKMGVGQAEAAEVETVEVLK
jgi:hypothetical protein